MMFRLIVVAMVGLVLTVPGGQEAEEAVEIGEGPALSILEGTLIRQSQGLFTTVLKTDAGQRCVLREGKQIKGDLRLRDIETGARLHVEGRLDSDYYDAGELRPPNAAPSTWVIYMAVQSIERIDRAPAPPAEPLPQPKD